MILGVNGIRLASHRSGVARCIEAILNCMPSLDHPFREVRLYTPKPLPAEVSLPSLVRVLVLPSPVPLALWEQWTLPRAHNSGDVLLCPSYVVPLMARCPTLLIHHGSYEGYPQAFDWWTLNKARLAYSLSARRATVVSTVSEFSRRDMVRYYGMKSSQIHVVPEGVHTDVFRPIRDPERIRAWRQKRLGADSEFLCYVGKPTERRNLTSLIRAFAELKRRAAIPHKLLIAGADLPGTSPFRQVIEELGLGSEVIVLGYVGHDEMPLVYNAASMLIYPSSYEGFGMPVLEAMACGTPVIALNNTAFPEFAGGVALLLDSAEVQVLAKGIQQILADPELRERMAREGPRRAASYDWKVITQRYLDLMRPLAEKQEIRGHSH